MKTIKYIMHFSLKNASIDIPMAIENGSGLDPFDIGNHIAKAMRLTFDYPEEVEENNHAD